MKNKCCGNCKYFKDEDANGEGFCEVKYEFESCCHECDNHEFRNNGWTELTPDNVDEINADLIVLTDGTYYKMANDWHASLSTLAKVGGYSYYVLPELKIE